jgi:hypothetical protein
MLGSIGEKKAPPQGQGISSIKGMTTDKTSGYQKTHIFFGGGSEWVTHFYKPKPNRWTRGNVAQLVSAN